jgi:hypothetical protein
LFVAFFSLLLLLGRSMWSGESRVKFTLNNHEVWTLLLMLKAV